MPLLRRMQCEWDIEMGIGRGCDVNRTWATWGHRHPFGVDVPPDGRNTPFWITCDDEFCGFVMLSPGSNPEELVKVSRSAQRRGPGRQRGGNARDPK